MAFYEVVARQPDAKLIFASADNLKAAKELRDQQFNAGSNMVFIRQYIKGGERYRVLHALTKRRF